jgi:hypothetical protein
MDKTKWAYLTVQLVPVEVYARVTSLIDALVMKFLDTTGSRRQHVKYDPGLGEWHHISRGMQNETWVARHSGREGLDDEIVAEKGKVVGRAVLAVSPLLPARNANQLRERSPGNARSCCGGTLPQSSRHLERLHAHPCENGVQISRMRAMGECGSRCIL